MKSKLNVVFGIMLVFCFIFVGCSNGNIPGMSNRGDKILIVEVQGENVGRDADVSEESLIRQALDKGGSIVLNIEILRTIDNEFDSKYTASNSSGQFYTRPAILNFVGGQGWHLLQVFGLPGNPQYFFVKPIDKR